MSADGLRKLRDVDQRLGKRPVYFDEPETAITVEVHNRAREAPNRHRVSFLFDAVPLPQERGCRLRVALALFRADALNALLLGDELLQRCLCRSHHAFSGLRQRFAASWSISPVSL